MLSALYRPISVLLSLYNRDFLLFGYHTHVAKGGLSLFLALDEDLALFATVVADLFNLRHVAEVDKV